MAKEENTALRVAVKILGIVAVKQEQYEGMQVKLKQRGNSNTSPMFGLEASLNYRGIVASGVTNFDIEDDDEEHIIAEIEEMFAGIEKIAR